MPMGGARRGEGRFHVPLFLLLGTALPKTERRIWRLLPPPHASGDSISSAAGEIYEFCAKNIIMAVAAAGDCGAEPDGTQTYLHFGGGLPSSRGAMLGLTLSLAI